MIGVLPRQPTGGESALRVSLQPNGAWEPATEFPRDDKQPSAARPAESRFRHAMLEDVTARALNRGLLRAPTGGEAMLKMGPSDWPPPLPIGGAAPPDRDDTPRSVRALIALSAAPAPGEEWQAVRERAGLPGRYRGSQMWSRSGEMPGFLAPAASPGAVAWACNTLAETLRIRRAWAGDDAEPFDEFCARELAVQPSCLLYALLKTPRLRDALEPKGAGREAAWSAMPEHPATRLSGAACAEALISAAHADYADPRPGCRVRRMASRLDRESTPPAGRPAVPGFAAEAAETMLEAARSCGDGGSVSERAGALAIVTLFNLGWADPEAASPLRSAGRRAAARARAFPAPLAPGIARIAANAEAAARHRRDVDAWLADRMR